MLNPAWCILQSEDNLRQLSNCSQWFLFLKETKWLSVLENHDKQSQLELHNTPNPFPRSRHTASRIRFSSAHVLSPTFLPRGQSILWGGHSSHIYIYIYIYIYAWYFSLSFLLLFLNQFPTDWEIALSFTPKLVRSYRFQGNFLFNIFFLIFSF